MKSTIFITFIILALFINVSRKIYSQEKQSKTFETIFDKSSGDDKNIINKSKSNNPDDKTQVPAWKDEFSKGSGNGTCVVFVRNYTNWFIDIYVDGYYNGTLGPWEDRYTYTGSGNTKIYGRAEFSDGEYYYWGPEFFGCEYNYTWNFKKKSN